MVDALYVTMSGRIIKTPGLTGRPLGPCFPSANRDLRVPQGHDSIMRARQDADACLVGESSNGRTADSGSANRGSNPRSPANLSIITVPSSSGPGHRVLSPGTGVRIPLGLPLLEYTPPLTGGGVLLFPQKRGRQSSFFHDKDNLSIFPLTLNHPWDKIRKDASHTGVGVFKF